MEWAREEKLTWKLEDEQRGREDSREYSDTDGETSFTGRKKCPMLKTKKKTGEIRTKKPP